MNTLDSVTASMTLICILLILVHDTALRDTIVPVLMQYHKFRENKSSVNEMIKKIYSEISSIHVSECK